MKTLCHFIFNFWKCESILNIIITYININWNYYYYFIYKINICNAFLYKGFMSIINYVSFFPLTFYFNFFYTKTIILLFTILLSFYHFSFSLCFLTLSFSNQLRMCLVEILPTINKNITFFKSEFSFLLQFFLKLLSISFCPKMFYCIIVVVGIV